MTGGSDFTSANLDVFARWEDRPWGWPWAGDAALTDRAAKTTEIGMSRSMTGLGVM